LYVLVAASVGCSQTEGHGDLTDAGGADLADLSGDAAPPGETLTVVRIVDQSEECDPTEDSDPGADIFAVGLETESGEPIAWGSVAWDNVLAMDNDFASTAPIDGKPLQLMPQKNCPDPLTDQNSVSLGCNGWIAVEFLDSDGDGVDLTAASHNRVRVYEADRQCDSDSSDDQYDLWACKDADAVKTAGDPGSCEIPLLTGSSGEDYAPLTGF
jgi:hypothetical protein